MNAPSTSKGHPTGLYVLFVTEMWERFSYYGMRAIFVLFLTKALLMSGKDASNLYGSYTGLVYLTPLIGGYISDRYWGNRRSIFIGGILMAIGQFLMFFSGNLVQSVPGQQGVALPNDLSFPMMIAGLTFLIIGNGFFKPNISTMVGQLYSKTDSRVDGAFTIFYMGINLGAFFSPLVCGGFGDTGNVIDFKWGFLAAGIGMVVSTITFELLKNKYIVDPDGNPVGMPPSRSIESTPSNPDLNATTTSLVSLILASFAVFYYVSKDIGSSILAAVCGGVIINTSFNSILSKSKGFAGASIVCSILLVMKFVFDLDYVGSFIFSATIGIPYLIISDSTLTRDEKSRIWVIFILAFFVIFFWSAFEQAGASLTIFADTQTNRTLGTWEMPASWFQSINPLGIIILAPLFSSLWINLGRRGMEPPSPLKMAIGLLLLCVGYVVIAMGVHGVDSSVKISMWWLVILYVLHTMGELCLSPIGLSMVSKLAPARFASLLMGTWFLANAAANKLAGSLSALIPPGAGEAPAEAAAAPAIILGFPIDNLFNFFMIFIVMSGAAAVLLFLLYRWLSKMMKGVH